MMKRSVLLTVLTLLVLTLSSVAVEAAVTSTTNFSSSTPTFGDVNQEASNPLSDRDSDKDIIVSKAVTLQSSLSGGEQITGITVVPESGFTTTDLNIVLKDTNPTISNTGTAVNFEARIPEQLDAADQTTYEAKAFKVARVDLLNGQNVVGSFDVYMQRKNQLVIDHLDVVVTNAAGSQDSKSLNTDKVDKLKNIKPGDELEVTVRVENRFKSSANIAVEDIDVEADLIGSDFDDADDDSLGDLSEDDKDDVVLNLQVDEDADKQTADMSILITGFDENGAFHAYLTKADVEVDRETHEIIVQGLTFTPSVLTCNDDSAQLSVKVKNIGRRDEDSVAIGVESNTLNFRDRESNLQMDRDDTRTKVFNIPVGKNLEAGKYAVQVQTFTDNTDLSNTEIVLLESICEEKAVIESAENTLVLQENSFDLKAGKSFSVPVLIKNTGSELADFVISVTNADDFAEPVASKTMSLVPGQQTTSFFNMKARDDLKAGSYSASIIAQSKGVIVDTETFTVTVEGDASAEETGSSGFGQSQILWIILDVFLVIIAIFFIKMIFSGRKRGVKMRDIKLQ